MSSQLRGSVFGNRAKFHTIVVARGERVRHWTVPSWALGAAALGMAVVTIGGIGAIGLSLTGDSVVRMMIDREIRTTTVYEKRISGLRQELDKLTTRQHIDRDQISKQLESLLSQQAQLVGRFEKLEPLLSQAAGEGLIDPATTGSIKQDPEAWDVIGRIGKALAPQKTAQADPVDHIRDVVLPSIRESVGLVEGQQVAGLAKLSQEAAEKVDRMSALLRPFGWRPAKAASSSRLRPTRLSTRRSASSKSCSRAWTTCAGRPSAFRSAIRARPVRSALRPSAFVPTRFSAARRCTPASISQDRREHPSTPRAKAGSFRPATKGATGSRSRSIMETASPRASPIFRGST